MAITSTPSGRGYTLAFQRRPLSLPGGPRAWISVDRADGRTLAEQSSSDVRRPASTTKVLTALTAVHRLPANATVPISARSASVIPTEAGALAGQVWSLRDAMHGLLLPSGNDIAYALAERISRSVQAFGAVMQAESNALGLSTASNWRDPAGLDSSVAVGGGNWSTARDLARLGRAVLDDPVLGPVVGTLRYTYAGPYGSPRTTTTRTSCSPPTPTRSASRRARHPRQASAWSRPPPATAAVSSPWSWAPPTGTPQPTPSWRSLRSSASHPRRPCVASR